MFIKFDSVDDIIKFVGFVCDSFDGSLSNLSFLNDNQRETIFNAVYDFMNIFTISDYEHD